MNIQPFENLVLSGFSGQFYKVFGAGSGSKLWPWVTSVDVTRTLKKMLEGKELELPYGYIVLQGMEMPSDQSRHNSNYMARRGLIVGAGDDGNTYQSIRLIPVTLNVECNYVTNRAQGEGSALAFARRWMFARRCGYLKFQINYGKLTLRIGVTMDGNVTIPQRESLTETDSTIKITANAQILGFVGEPYETEVGRINDLQFDESVNARRETWSFKA